MVVFIANNLNFLNFNYLLENHPLFSYLFEILLKFTENYSIVYKILKIFYSLSCDCSNIHLEKY